jgi:hypothetical protein
MINSQTVFVIGAGASVDFDLPLGDALTGNISKALSQIDVDDGYPSLKAPAVWHGAITRSVISTGRNINDYVNAARTIARDVQLRPSIDEYLRLHRENDVIRELGKMAIYDCILKGERAARRALLSGSDNLRTINLTKVKSTWYWPLWTAMSEGCELSKPEDVLNNVTFIIFNYDRCLELFLSSAISQMFGVTLEQAAEMVAKRVIHPYGSLGPLAGNGIVPFGQDDDRILPLECNAALIRTFFETKDTAIEGDLHLRMTRARNIFFIGFGFHRQNMELLRTFGDDPDDSPPFPNRATRIFATMVQTSAEQRLHFQQRIHETIWPGNDQVHFELPRVDLSATQLINDAHFALTAEPARSSVKA